MTVDGNYGGIANSSIANNTDYQLRGVAHASALHHLRNTRAHMWLFIFTSAPVVT